MLKGAPGCLEQMGGAPYAEGARFSTWVQIIVVRTSLWPSNSWMVRMSAPRSSRWVALPGHRPAWRSHYECRKVWQLAGFAIPEATTARRTFF